uniref:G-protein coupled receptors family 1 profile domain-containing protein n=1 Tax=Plectus sambesii TaxID=2011161 RepID=A0A914XHC4_9BILA
MFTFEQATSTPTTGKQSNSSDIIYCEVLPDIIRVRRFFDIISSSLGIVPSTIHILVILYLKYIRKSKSLEYLLATSVLSILALIVIASSALFDLCILPQQNEVLFFYRGRIWLFVQNGLQCTYAYMIVVLCLDRFVALHKPLFFKETFVRLKVRVFFTLVCVVIGILCGGHWLVFDQVYYAKAVHEEKIVENTAITGEVCQVHLKGNLL